MTLPRNSDGHPVCPIDGELLSGMRFGMLEPTVYIHRDQSWHLDPLSEAVGALTLPDQCWSPDTEETP